MTLFRVELPWPVSVNRYWRRAGKHIHTSTEARQYRARVGQLVRDCHRFGTARIAVAVVAYPPDNRRRDLDNIGKVLWDALQHAGIYTDDSQIREIFMVFGPVRKPDGAVLVTIREM